MDVDVAWFTSMPSLVYIYLLMCISNSNCESICTCECRLVGGLVGSVPRGTFRRLELAGAARLGRGAAPVFAPFRLPSGPLHCPPFNPGELIISG